MRFRTRHGHTRVGGRTPTYTAWHSMKQRCGNPDHLNFDRYGGRGITVCERWLDFVNFLADMGERPAGLASIDRIDGDGNYEPGNCRWATHKEQCNNWSGERNKHVIYEGQTYTLQELSDKLGLNRYTLRRRVMGLNWPPEHWGDPPSKRKRATHF